MTKNKRLLKIWLLCITAMPLLAVAQTKSPYDQLKVFDPAFFTHNGNEFRSANGAPGTKYWQNAASYTIHAALSEKDTSITGDVVIKYTNNSPDTLNYLWLQLDQNLFRSDSRGTAATPITGSRYDVKKYTKGYQITSVSVTYMVKATGSNR